MRWLTDTDGQHTWMDHTLAFAHWQELSPLPIVNIIWSGRNLTMKTTSRESVQGNKYAWMDHTLQAFASLNTKQLWQK